MTQTANSIIESIGVYLPPRQVTTDEILKGCVNRVRVPLERLTGIQSRHRAGESEFSIDLAIKAVEDCLKDLSADPGVIPDLTDEEKRGLLVEFDSRRRLVFRQCAIEAWLAAWRTAEETQA